MRSDTTQLDIYRDSPKAQAQHWRAAAEASLQQFPHDTERHRYYIENAERLEAMTR